MADVTVAQFADVLKVPVDKLLAQLDEAGIKVSGSEDTISEEAKLELLTHLRRSHGQDATLPAAPKRITLKRKSQSELRLSGAQGRSRTVNVEVRRKRTYIKRDVLEEQAQKEQAELDRRRREEQERLEAEKREQERLRAEREQQARAEEDKRKEDAARQQAEQEAREAAARAAAEEKARLERAEQDARERRQKEKQKAAAPTPKPTETRYGRKELHVAGDKSGRRKRKTPLRRRPVSLSTEGQHGFERPTAPVVREV